MKVLVDIIHPGDVHFFRLAIDELQKRGHEVTVTARVKDVATDLLENYGIDFTCLSEVGKGRFDLLCELFIRDFRLWRFCRKFKPDVLTGVSGIFASHVGFLLRKPSIVWDDTEHQKQIHMITWPTATVVCSPDCYTKSAGKKHRLYPGVHELAYLHPDRFTPDTDVVKSLGIDPSERFCIIRMVGWGACHDVGEQGFADEQKLDFIKKIAEHARPYITAEGDLPAELTEYQLPIPVHKFHHALAFASLCVTEGATVASEAAVLGVPTVYLNSLKVGYVNMLEGYGLIKQAVDTEDALKLSLELLNDENVPGKYKTAREKLLSDKIDMTDYIIETILEFTKTTKDT